jgi:biopolymer transport protein ExbD
MVTVAADGSIYVGAQLRTEEELVAFAKEAAARDPQARIVIAADRGVQHGRVIRVMDLLKQGGISKFGFAVSVKD